MNSRVFRTAAIAAVMAAAAIGIALSQANPFKYNGLSYTSTGVTFTNLGLSAQVPQTNGTMVYCSDCTTALPCAGGGTGAIAKRINGSWNCLAGGTGTFSVNGLINGQAGATLNGLAGAKTDGSDNLTGFNVNGQLNALDFSGADIGAKVNAAVATLGANGGTVFIPAGAYTYTTPIALTKTTCNATIAGDSQGGTVLKPNFSNGDAISFIDSLSENPPVCKGGVHDVKFLPSGAAPTNLNLIRVSNVVGLDLHDIYALNFNGTGDSTIYLDGGIGPGGTTFTERTHMRNIVSMYSQFMLTLDAQSVTAESLNNNILANSHCDTMSASGSACIRIINAVSGSILEGGRYEFDGNINNAGASAISLSSNTNGGAINGAEFDFRVQNAASSYCFNFDGASPIYVAPRGSGYCLNANHNVVSAWQDKTKTESVFIPTTSGVAGATIYGAYVPSFYHKTSDVVTMQVFATTVGVGCATAPVIDLDCNGSDQTGMGVTLGNGVGYAASSPTVPLECSTTNGIGVIVHTAASGCGTYPANINIVLEMAEGMPNL